jgi:hypothetical protein
MVKLTRRQLAAALAATAPLAAQESPPQPATPAEELKAAAERLRRTTGSLAKFPVPMAAEPAFSFKA